MRDIAPLGHRLRTSRDGTQRIETYIPSDLVRNGEFWRGLHFRRYIEGLRKEAGWIREFEKRSRDIFAARGFKASKVRPVLEVIDWADPLHLELARYLMLYQTTRSRKLVGRRVGLLIWDEGQRRGRPLVGVALLSSAIYAQRHRDRYFNWVPSFPKDSPRYDAAGERVRILGLSRIMQLSVACSLPPYSFLRGAWFSAIMPFLPEAQGAFEAAARSEADPDLAAVVTTTGLDVSGMPFRGHRVAQLSGGGFRACAGTAGEIYARIAVDDELPLRASFKDLVSPATRHMARTLFEREASQNKRKDPDVGSQILGTPARLFFSE